MGPTTGFYAVAIGAGLAGLIAGIAATAAITSGQTATAAALIREQTATADDDRERCLALARRQDEELREVREAAQSMRAVLVANGWLGGGGS